MSARLQLPVGKKSFFADHDGERIDVDTLPPDFSFPADFSASAICRRERCRQCTPKSLSSEQRREFQNVEERARVVPVFIFDLRGSQLKVDGRMDGPGWISIWMDRKRGRQRLT